MRSGTVEAWRIFFSPTWQTRIEVEEKRLMRQPNHLLVCVFFVQKNIFFSDNKAEQCCLVMCYRLAKKLLEMAFSTRLSWSEQLGHDQLCLMQKLCDDDGSRPVSHPMPNHNIICALIFSCTKIVLDKHMQAHSMMEADQSDLFHSHQVMESNLGTRAPPGSNTSHGLVFFQGQSSEREEKLVMTDMMPWLD